MYVATIVAVVLGGLIAMIPDANGVAGKGGLILWPLFGATNQLLAGLAFMVIAFYLWRRDKPIWFVVLPMIVMIIMPAWALLWQLFSTEIVPGTEAPVGWFWSFKDKWLLASIALITLSLQIWMVIEALMIWPKAKGCLLYTSPSPRDRG